MLDKIKNWLGIEGVNISILSVQVHSESRRISGTVSLSTASEQHIESLIVRVEEKYTRGRSKSKLSDIYTIGLTQIEINQSIVPEDDMQFGFELSYQLKLSSVDRFGQRNLLNRLLAKTAKTLKGASSTYTCTAELIVSGNRLKPYDTRRIQL